MVQQGYIPVVAPIGVGEEGEAFNINADVVAGKLAECLNAEKLIMLTNTQGVLDEHGQLINKLSPKDIDRLITSGTLQGGMLLKIHSTLQAALNGISDIHIIDGRGHMPCYWKYLLTKGWEQ
jgi:acetylglutamate kinase